MRLVETEFTPLEIQQHQQIREMVVVTEQQ
jgi:hypothetical protein